MYAYLMRNVYEEYVELYAIAMTLVVTATSAKTGFVSKVAEMIPPAKLTKHVYEGSVKVRYI